MTARLPASALRHARVGPNIDAAPCGARGLGVVFVLARRHITCPRCVEMRANGPAGVKQLAKLRKVSKAITAARRAGFSARYE
jgi:hypothetical protein